MFDVEEGKFVDDVCVSVVLSIPSRLNAALLNRVNGDLAISGFSEKRTV